MAGTPIIRIETACCFPKAEKSSGIARVEAQWGIRFRQSRPWRRLAILTGGDAKLGAVLEVQLSGSGLARETDCESGESTDDERRSEDSEGARSVAPVQGL
jgi:hypothetical protein